MKNILIIGGTGFIGRNIIEALYEGRFNIVLLSRDEKFFGYERCRDVKLINGCLSDVSLIKNILSEENIDVVIHLASSLIPGSNKNQFYNELKEIIFPTIEILDYIACLNIKIIFFSSGGAIYGSSNQNIDETYPLYPINYYGQSKLIIEKYMLFLNSYKGLRYVILRPSNVYGKYQRIESEQGFIAVAAGKMISGNIIDIWGKGDAIRDYVNVSDVAKVVRNILEQDIENEIFNLGTGIGHTLLNIINILEEQLDIKANIEFKDNRIIDLERITLNIGKLSSFVEYDPVELKVGVVDFIKTLLKN